MGLDSSTDFSFLQLISPTHFCFWVCFFREERLSFVFSLFLFLFFLFCFVFVFCSLGGISNLFFFSSMAKSKYLFIYLSLFSLCERQNPLYDNFFFFFLMLINT